MVQWAFAQTTEVSGRVTDAATQEPIAFANVYFKGTQIGASTNFEGYYTISTTEHIDSIQASFLGYVPKTKAIQRGVKQTIDLQLDPTSFQLDAISITPGRNPAYRILDSVWAHRQGNDVRQLTSYQYESYTKVQVDVDNISDKFRNRTIMKPFTYLFDSLDVAAGEDGRPVLPIFVSETLSDYYYQDAPLQRKEHIKASNVTGVGMEDGSYITQFVGSSFHDYNFYQNNLTILEHSVVSPISSEAKGFYVHILEDSMWIGNKWCYQIKLAPKREEDIVFNGTMWIQDTTWAIVTLSVEVVGTANLNFIERYKIQQELEPTEAGPWLPVKTRILMDIEEPTDESFGMLAKVYVSNKDIAVNQEYEPKFFKDDLSVDAMAQMKADTFWEAHRHEALTDEDQTIYSLVDSIRDFPRIRTYIDVAKVLTSGYFRVTPKIEFGSYLLTYGTNVIERHRFRLGFRTTSEFSKQSMIKAYGAYGLRDQRFKYGVIGETFLSRNNWTKIGYQYKHDLEGIGAPDDYEELNPLLEAATQLGLLSRMNKVELHRFWFHTDLHRSITQKIIFTSKFYAPEGEFTYAYFPDLNDKSEIRTSMRTTELAFETVWTPLETKLINDNKRTRLHVHKAPNFTFRYSLGLKGPFGGQFNYHKFDLGVSQIARLGVMGRGEYIARYNKVLTPLPYLLLHTFPGNETLIRTLSTYNMMDFFEFVADESLMLFYVHHFDGVLMNRIPVVQKLKWRMVLSGKMAVGSLSDDNLAYMAPFDAYDQPVTPVNTLEPGKPYYEIGYGFENIFRFMRIQAYHRLSYTQNRPNNFGIRGSVYFNF